MVLTDVERVFLSYGKGDDTALGTVDPATLRRLAAEGHFPSGSMGPKV